MVAARPVQRRSRAVCGVCSQSSARVCAHATAGGVAASRGPAAGAAGLTRVGSQVRGGAAARRWADKCLVSAASGEIAGDAAQRPTHGGRVRVRALQGVRSTRRPK